MPDTTPKLRLYQTDALRARVREGESTARILRYCREQGFPQITPSAVAYHRRAEGVLLRPLRAARRRAAFESGLIFRKALDAEADQRLWQFIADNPPGIRNMNRPA